MDELRLILAIGCFCLGIYLVYDLWVVGFHWAVLAGSLGSFVAAHYIKPDKTTADDWSVIWELLDLLIDVPFKVISLFLRGLGKIFKGDAGGVDL